MIRGRVSPVLDIAMCWMFSMCGMCGDAFPLWWMLWGILFPCSGCCGDVFPLVMDVAMCCMSGGIFSPFVEYCHVWDIAMCWMIWGRVSPCFGCCHVMDDVGMGSPMLVVLGNVVFQWLLMRRWYSRMALSKLVLDAKLMI